MDGTRDDLRDLMLDYCDSPSRAKARRIRRILGKNWATLDEVRSAERLDVHGSPSTAARPHGAR